MFTEPPLLLSRFIHLFVHLSLYIRHMINTLRDTVRTRVFEFLTPHQELCVVMITLGSNKVFSLTEHSD